MKKLLIVAAMFASGAVFAQQAGTQTTNVTTASGASSTSTSNGGAGGAGGAGGSVSGVNASNGLTVGCLVNCASTDQGAKDAADATVQAALINAAAARDVAASMRDTKAVVKNTPSVSGPALVSSNDTCMGSTSGSVNIAGLGIGGGTSWVDGNCKMLKNSRELWNMGMKAAALALMCTDTANREALELTGFECPQTTKAKADQAAATKAAAAAQQPEYTDPIVRARLGLPPIVASK
jgi:hypothetical protein